MRSIIIILMSMLLISCDINIKFDQEDKVWLNTYKEGDLLIFGSEARKDSILIKNIEISNTDRDVLASSYNPIGGIVNYKDLYSNEINYIYAVSKNEPNTPTEVMFHFKGDKGRITDIHNYPISIINIKGRVHKGYLFKPYSKEKQFVYWDLEYGLKNPTLEYFFWDKEFGIIEYKTMEGEVFILEKFIRDGENILEL